MNSRTPTDEEKWRALDEAQIDAALADLHDFEESSAPSERPATSHADLDPSLKTLVTLKLTGLPSIYDFPSDGLPDGLLVFDPATLIATLERLWAMVGRQGKERVTDEVFLKLRKAICAINIELNHLGHISPRFRPMKKKLMRPVKPSEAHPRGNAINDPREHMLSRDRMVIDLNWIWWQYRRDGGASAPCRLSDRDMKLCWSPEFDFDLAAEFASERRYAKHRVEDLKLDRLTEWQLSVIQRKKTAIEWKRIRADGSKFERFIRGLAARTPGLRGRSGAWGNTWIAGQIAEGSPKIAGEFIEWMTGSPPNDKGNFGNHLRKVNRRAAECFGTS